MTPSDLPTPSCVFCGAEGPLTAEHVMPRWLAEHFPGSDQRVEMYRQRVSPEDQQEHRFEAPPFTQRVRDVCAACNNGWMSRLEAQARRLMTSMIAGEAVVLDPSDQTTLALWAQKTAAIAALACLGGEAPMSPAAFRWIKEQQMPVPASAVWLGRYHDEGHWPFVFHFHRGSVGKQGEDWPVEPNMFDISFAVGPVCFWTFGHEHPESPRFSGTSEPRLTRIWLPHEPDVTWPPPGVRLDNTALEVLSRTLPGGLAPRVVPGQEPTEI